VASYERPGAKSDKHSPAFGDRRYSAAANVDQERSVVSPESTWRVEILDDDAGVAV
jgi:hypothetical protein